MSIAKTIEISASSPNSFDEAVKHGVQRASKTVQNIREAWVKEQKVVVDGGAVKEYRVHMNITFMLND